MNEQTFDPTAQSPKKERLLLPRINDGGILGRLVKTTMSSGPRTQYDAIAAELAATSPATTGQMFGMPCLKNNGKAFAGFYQGAMVFKLGAPKHAEALALSGARLFDPSERGRPMKEWVEVPGEHASRWLELAREAMRYVGT